MKFDEATNKFTVHKENVNYANGNTRDRQGRLISCEHSITRRVVRTEPGGRMTVLAGSFEGKRLNTPNDIVVSTQCKEAIFQRKGAKNAKNAKFKICWASLRPLQLCAFALEASFSLRKHLPCLRAGDAE